MAFAWTREAKTVTVSSEIAPSPSPLLQSEASTAPDSDDASWEMRQLNATCREDGAYAESAEVSSSGSEVCESTSKSCVLTEFKASSLLRRRPQFQIEDLRISSNPDIPEDKNLDISKYELKEGPIGQRVWIPGVGFA
mmetsp:Transcript_101502/g.217335  ORF Transcript_101502/g.217335 Transcript_101502/m.217335 type:complete len:138 (+) Transcript_101502:90-503(+)